jgi:hypothetical protein
MKKTGILIVLSLLSTFALAIGAAPAGHVAAATPLTIDPGPLGDGNVGTSYVAFITSNGGQGSPHRFKVIAGRLPDGLRMADSYGMQSTVISGTPTRVQTASFTVRAQDPSVNTATQAFTITINPVRPLVITNDSSNLPTGTVGTPYNGGFSAGGGTQPYRWSIAAGQLPSGIRLDNNILSGTPTTPGTFTFTIRLTDNSGQQTSRAFTIAIN